MRAVQIRSPHNGDLRSIMRIVKQWTRKVYLEFFLILVVIIRRVVNCLCYIAQNKVAMGIVCLNARNARISWFPVQQEHHSQKLQSNHFGDSEEKGTHV
jgi:hypothetical protein